MDACPCGAGGAYADCCGRFHAGAEPATAQQLMRARYSAFVRGETAFLIRTTHPLLRARLDPADLRRTHALSWLGLEIVEVELGGPADREGMVHFRARFRGPDGQERVHDERSRFSRADGCWVYRDDRG